ncbi:MAG: DNA helicase, partial [Deltaproteobacteria bacterium]|nr:DNA helicase [Deltaproteobacteria bacterium]
RETLADADSLAGILREAGGQGGWGAEMRKSAEALLRGGSAAPEAAGAAGGAGAREASWGERVREAEALAGEFAREARALMGLLGWGGDAGALEFAAAARAAGDALAFRDSLASCVQYLALRAEAESLGLGPFAEALEGGRVPEGGESRSLERSFRARFAFHAVGEDPGTFAMAREDRGYLLDLLRRSYESKLAGAVDHVRGLRRAPGFADGVPRQEMNLLLREHSKKRRHLPIRRLLSGLPELVRRLTPCLLMSPQSVAQYLPADSPPFDLVIFDEASQIPSADAVGALARGRRAVVVGDPKQLPPTEYFARRLEPQEAPDGEVGDDPEPLESILDDCLAAGLPRVSLAWHYRSRSESLISFSNSRYYGGGLVTFPSPDSSGRAVSFRKVDGVYGRGGGKTNRIEAEAAVAETVALLRSPEAAGPGFSVGIVTFNQAQQELIEDLLERERSADPAIDRFFDPALEEPVIVKNLENIQGDERGVILFSVGYGPDAEGKMSLNFGPLNKAGGERRLNVAITRARRAVRVLASFLPEAIATGPATPRGVVDLRDFMAYALAGGAAAGGAGGGPASDFAAFVAEGLARRGWETEAALGASGLKMDLAVADPGRPGQYLAGIECDGESYRDAATAVDREILRGEVLAGLGWRILRVWSMEWWKPSGLAEANARLDELDAELREMARLRREGEARAGDVPGSSGGGLG